MARTTTRTQMITGMLLAEISGLLSNIEDISPAILGDREWEQLRNDSEYLRAHEILQDLFIREMRKTQGRAEGSACDSLDEINEITMTEA